MNLFEAKAKGLKIGITAGTFELLHAGHVMMLEEAKSQCDYLIVALQTDPTIDRPEKHAPTQSVLERHLQLRACKYVDEVIVYETEADLLALLLALPIDVRILSEEYENKKFTGIELPISLYFNKRAHTWSSSELSQRVYATTAERLSREQRPATTGPSRHRSRSRNGS